MKRLVIKSKGRMWPSVTWRGSRLVIYYLREDAENVRVEETRHIDFEELLLRLDEGESAFITMLPKVERSSGLPPRQIRAEPRNLSEGRSGFSRGRGPPRRSPRTPQNPGALRVDAVEFQRTGRPRAGGQVRREGEAAGGKPGPQPHRGPARAFRNDRRPRTGGLGGGDGGSPSRDYLKRYSKR